MPRFKKRPVVIEAVQWTGENIDDVNDIARHDHLTNYQVRNGGLVIHTLEGDMHVAIGDFVIRGVKGELYPCKPDIFAATYEQEPEDCYGG